MKNLLSLTLILSFLSFGNLSFAQDEVSTDSVELVSDTSAVQEDVTVDVIENSDVIEEEIEVVEEVVQSKGFHQAIKELFIQGGWQFMGIVLLCLILGLAVSIERIITLNLATTDTNKLLSDVDDALKNKGGVNAAKEISSI